MTTAFDHETEAALDRADNSRSMGERMTVWEIVETKAPGDVVAHHFSCGSCAVQFYNADRERRQAPDPVEPRDGVAVIDACDHGKVSA